MEGIWGLEIDELNLLSFLDKLVLVLEVIFLNEVVVEKGSPNVDGCPFAIDVSSAAVFFKVVNSSGECDSFLSLLSCLSVSYTHLTLPTIYSV